jgi:hypothetical protein
MKRRLAFLFTLSVVSCKKDMPVEKFSVELSPNPCTTYFKVNVKPVGPAYTLQLHDMEGRLKLNIVTRAEIQTVQVDTLKVGLYILRAMREDTISQKILISR